MSTTQGAWLTPDACERLIQELRSLLADRDADEVGEPWFGTDIASPGDDSGVSATCEVRISQLRDLLSTATVGVEPPDDGVAEPGMVLTVRFEDDESPETFLLAVREEGVFGDIEVYSPDSPLGTALCGASQGEQRRYQLPSGQAMAVTLLDAIPFRFSFNHAVISSSTARADTDRHTEVDNDACD